MRLRKIKIVADLAHFKKPFATKYHFTYEIPPISTVVGIIQNLFSENIDDFVFGCIFEQDGIFKDLQRIWKEVNLKTNFKGERYKNDMWKSDVCEIDYLINPKLIIYTDIEEKINISECLNLGKTDCLAKVVSDEIIELECTEGNGYNQWTSIDVKGNNLPERISIETKYNSKKGYYDIYTKLIRLNSNFRIKGYYDEEEDQIIYLWKRKQVGEINEFN